MARRLRPIGHDDRLSVVDHLDELRSRLFVCLSVLVVAFGLCFWQSSRLLHLLDKPYTHAKSTQNQINGASKDDRAAAQHLRNAAGSLQLLSRQNGMAASESALLANTANQIDQAAKALPQKSPAATPLTIGVGEPFTVTLTVSLYFAIVLSLPVLLYQIFAFVLPALEPREKAAAVPIMFVAPFLFVAGVVFTYLIVLPAAIKFLQGYNASHFQSLVQAKQLYTFEALTMGAIGLTFEMPIILLGLHAAGLIDGQTLTKHWRYAVVILAVVAAAMPGADPVTTALETAPLVVLFLVSIVLLKFADRRKAKRRANELSGELGGLSTGA